MKIYLALLLLLTATLSHAQAGSVHIVLSGDAEIYQEAAHQIERQLSRYTQVQQPRIHALNAVTSGVFNNNDLIVTIGDKAATVVVAAGLGNNVIFGFVDKAILPAGPSTKWTATVITQPIQRLLAVTDALLEDQYKNKILVPVSDDNTDILNQLQRMPALEHGELEIVVITAGENPAKLIDEKLFNAAALVAINDKKLWSGENAKWMLYQAYKYKVPVTGYSKKFLKAGALVSVYSSVTQIADTTASLIHQWSENNGKLMQTGVVNSAYNIEYNKNIARVLQKEVPENQTVGRDE